MVVLMKKNLTLLLSQVSKQMNAKFYLLDRMISYEETFSSTGLLPALVKRADQLASLCMGFGLGASYKDTEQGLLGAEVVFDEVTPTSLRLIFIMDVLHEMINSSPSSDFTPLDELLKESVFD
jgi:intracellular multiplication protein IcmS